MKKIYFGVMFLMMSMLVCAAPRTVEQAASLAASFQNEQTQKSGVRRAPAKAANMRLAKQVAKPTNMFEAALYVFNNPNGGWVIISADDNTETVIGYSNEGSFHGTQSNVIHMLNYYAERIDAASQMTETEKADFKAMRKAKKSVEPIAPLLKTKGIEWNQGTPYNNMCPIDQGTGKRCPTGCVATAAAQIMAYWQWPATGEGYTEYDWYSGSGGHGHESANFGATTYDWSNILQANYEKISYTQEQADAVALLNYHVGVATHMGYNSAGSASGTNGMAEGMKHYFRYKRGKYWHSWEGSSGTWHSEGDRGDNGWDTINHWAQLADMFDEDLEAGRPILMGGGGKSGSNGHEYVCEGRDENRMYYINYGWGGNADNGYYLLDNMYSTHNGPYQFSYDVDVVLNIYPDTTPVNVTGISIDQTSLSMKVGEKATLSATIAPANASNDGYWWSSSDNSVVTVSKDGNVSAISAGFATITATSFNGNHVASCEISVANEYPETPAAIALEFDGVYEKKVSSKGYFKLRLENVGTGDYPYMYINLDRLDNTKWTIAGYYTLGVGNNNINGWPSAEKGDKYTINSKSGWMNITYLGNSNYKIEAFFHADDNLDYSINYVADLSSFEGATLVDEVGDGAQYNVTFKSMGETFTTIMAKNGELAFPEDKPLSCNEMTFIGWTTEENYSYNVAPALVQEGSAITSDTTFYAVFGTPDGGHNPYSEVASISFLADGTDYSTYYDPNYNNNGTTAINAIIESANNMAVRDGQYLRQGANGLRIGGSSTNNERKKGSDGWWKQGFILFEFANQVSFTKMEINCSKKDNGQLQIDYNNAPHDKHDTCYTYSENLVITPSKPITLDSLSVATTYKSGYVKSITLYQGGEPTYNFFTTVSCPSHNITIADVENGTIETNQNSAIKDDKVTITAMPNTGYGLGDISVKDANNNDIIVVNNEFFMPASDVTVSATFKKLYNVNISTSIENGTVVADFSQAAAGQVVTLTATPNANYELATLTVSGGPGVGQIAVDENHQFIMPAANVMVMATFVSTAPAEYEIAINQNIVNGTVEADMNTAPEGATVTLTITPDECYELATLTIMAPGVNITVDENNQFIMPAKKIVVNATFSLIEYVINIEDTEHGTVEADFQKATSGEVVTITATPDEQYELASLIVTDDNNNIIDIENDGSFIMPCAAVTISAQFSKKDPTALNSVETEKTAIKLIEDGVVYIIRGGEKFDIYGQKVQ